MDVLPFISHAYQEFQLTLSNAIIVLGSWGHLLCTQIAVLYSCVVMAIRSGFCVEHDNLSKGLSITCDVMLPKC